MRRNVNKTFDKNGIFATMMHAEIQPNHRAIPCACGSDGAPLGFGKAAIAALHGSDIVSLTAVGMLFGVGFVGLIGRLRFPEK